MDASRKLCEQAQSCFSFVDREGLVDATADVYAAVRVKACLTGLLGLRACSPPWLFFGSRDVLGIKRTYMVMRDFSLL